MLGGRIVANRWTVTDARANGTADDRVSVLNPNDDVAALSVYRIAAGVDDPWQPVEGLQGLVLGGGDRIDIRLGDFARFDGDSVVVVTDGAPVFVDRSRVRVRESGDRPERPDLSTPAGRGMSVAAAAVPTTVPTRPTTVPTTAATDYPPADRAADRADDCADDCADDEADDCADDEYPPGGVGPWAGSPGDDRSCVDDLTRTLGHQSCGGLGLVARQRARRRCRHRLQPTPPRRSRPRQP